MDSFLHFLIRQKKLALAFTVSIIVLGILTLSNIQRDQFPAVDFEKMTIVTLYPGASPEDVEQNVTNIIEDELGSISGIDTFISTSKEGVSTIIVNFDQDASDIVALKQEVQNAVNRVTSLPKEVLDLPRIEDHKTSENSVLTVNIFSRDLDYETLRKTSDWLSDNVERVAGVSRVAKEGYLDREIQIRINPERLHYYKLSIQQVIEAIAARNKRWTVGNNHHKTHEKTIVLLSKFDMADSVSAVIVKSSFEGLIVRVRDIAKIVDSTVEEKSIIRVNGVKGFVLNIHKKANADVITTVDLVRAKIQALQADGAQNVQIFYSSDLSKHVRNRLEIVANNGMIGLVLVLLVLSAFLSFKTAFWVAISLPVSLLGTVAILGATGETINLVSLAAMILVLGIVVDDSIVVAESIHRYKQLGEDPLQAAVHGFKRVIMPVITTILTTILAFSSMFLMTGTMGKFIYIIPLVVIFALTLSFLEVSIALPAHLSGIRQTTRSHALFAYVERWFVRVLARALAWRYVVVLLFTGLLAGSLYFAATQMNFVLFPSVGVNTITVKLEMPVGTSLIHTEERVIEVEKIIMRAAGKDLDSLSSRVGNELTHVANLRIALLPESVTSDSAKILMHKIRAQTTELKGIKKIELALKRTGPPQGEDIEINIVGVHDTQRRAAANKLADILHATAGLDAINRDDEPGKERIEVVLDFERMARLKVNFFTVNQMLQTAFTGVNVTEMRDGQNDVQFRVYLGAGGYSESFISSLRVANRDGKLVPLKQFSTLRHIAGEPNIKHFNGQKSTLFTASVNDEITTVQAVIKTALTQLDAQNNYPNIRIISEGGAKETADSMQTFKQAFVLSIVGIFLLLTLLFNSYSQPLLIISAIPFSVIGVIWAFFLHNDALSFFSVLGTLALIGVIVNDSLVMVSHLNYLREKYTTQREQYTVQRPAIEWILEGAKDRLRAVVLTTLTTLAGVLPLAYGIGGTDYILQPMAMSLGYGLLFGTMMTLILLPCLYLMNYEFVQWLGRSRKSKTDVKAS